MFVCVFSFFCDPPPEAIPAAIPPKQLLISQVLRPISSHYQALILLSSKVLWSTDQPRHSIPISSSNSLSPNPYPPIIPKAAVASLSMLPMSPLEYSIVCV